MNTKLHEKHSLPFTDNKRSQYLIEKLEIVYQYGKSKQIIILEFEKIDETWNVKFNDTNISKINDGIGVTHIHLSLEKGYSPNFPRIQKKLENKENNEKVDNKQDIETVLRKMSWQ